MRHARSKIFTLAALLAATFILGKTASAQITEHNFRVGIGVDEKHPKGLAVTHFAELVKQRSGGKISITLYGNGKLGDDAKTVADAQRGTLDIAVPDTATLTSQVKGFGILNLPFLFTTESDADKLLDGPFGQKLDAGLEQIGLIGLGYWENGFRNMTNNVRPIARLQDFHGLRVRVIQNPLYIDTFKALGSEPVPLPFPELFKAMQENKIDGQENPLATIQSSKFYSVQKYLTLTRHVYSVWALVMSKPVWDKLSDQERKLIRDAAQEAKDYERKMIREVNDGVLDSLRKSGMAVNELSDLQRSTLRLATRPVIDKYKAEVGKEWTHAMYIGMANYELEKIKAPR